jgi:hypothetical protein
MMALFQSRLIADVQYHGQHGVTQSCLNAIVRVLHSEEWISKALLLSNSNFHCFYLELLESERIIIRPGFASGYGGEGPAGLAKALLMLEEHNIHVEEVRVSDGFMRRAADSFLTEDDLSEIDESRAVRPYRIGDYIHGILDRRGGYSAKTYYPPIVPYALVHPLIKDLSLLLSSAPDEAIFQAYRRLEQHITKRTGLSFHSSKLIRAAFEGEKSALHWDRLTEAQMKHRVSLFLYGFSFSRNPRAHAEFKTNQLNALREFLFVNELFLLESEAVERTMASNP